LAPSTYVTVPLSTVKVPTPNAPMAAEDAAVAGAAEDADDGVPKSQFARPSASVSRTITGSVSVSSTTSKRRDKSGNNATCTSTRFALTISAILLPDPLPNVTSARTTVGSTAHLRPIGPLMA